ncbi:MAG: hypothetical protein ACKPFK_23750, partial [Dolichospermum sp.]
MGQFNALLEELQALQKQFEELQSIPPVPVPQPQINQELTIDNKEPISNGIDNSETKLSDQQIIEILGIDEIIQNKGNKDFKIYIEWLEEQGIAKNMTNHRVAIETTLD